MFNCLPKCGGKKEAATSSKGVQLVSEHELVCGQCKTAQSVSKDSTVFVCLNCHSVNRVNTVTAADPVVLADSPVNPTETITLRRVNSSTFVECNDETVITPVMNAADNAACAIGPCSVCMDGAGDMIFQKCNHGGFCEACARHIAQNMAVGGAHCPRCREPITQVVRIVQMNQDIVTAVSVEVQTGGALGKTPPKVPPPRGFNKAKKR